MSALPPVAPSTTFSATFSPANSPILSEMEEQPAMPTVRVSAAVAASERVKREVFIKGSLSGGANDVGQFDAGGAGVPEVDDDFVALSQPSLDRDVCCVVRINCR